VAEQSLAADGVTVGEKTLDLLARIASAVFCFAV
jgi:hypothetical protein